MGPLRLFPLTLFLVVPLLVAQAPNGPDYTALNEAETRLAEFKDSPETLALKVRMLAVINQSRAQYQAPPVRLDILAGRVANRQCLEAARGRFFGHWNLRGEKPYLRYALAGGVDHVSENAAAVMSTGDLDPAQLFNYMAESHGRFMAERAPADGHKVNVIRKAHTHVGLGVALVGGEFRYYEEYLDRYLDTLEAPATVSPGETFTLRALPRAGYFGYLLMAYYEPFPQALTAAQVTAKGAYPDYTDETVFAYWPNRLEVGVDGAFSQELTLDRRGLYYVQIYLDTQPPFKTGSFSVTGKVQASGLVISVK